MNQKKIKVLITLRRSFYQVEFVITGKSTVTAGYLKGVGVHFNIVDGGIPTFKTTGGFL
jgi:hypothetical protein